MSPHRLCPLLELVKERGKNTYNLLTGGSAPLTTHVSTICHIRHWVFSQLFICTTNEASKHSHELKKQQLSNGRETPKIGNGSKGGRSHANIPLGTPRAPLQHLGGAHTGTGTLFWPVNHRRFGQGQRAPASPASSWGINTPLSSGPQLAGALTVVCG